MTPTAFMSTFVGILGTGVTRPAAHTGSPAARNISRAAQKVPAAPRKVPAAPEPGRTRHACRNEWIARVNRPSRKDSKRCATATQADVPKTARGHRRSVRWQSIGRAIARARTA